MENKTIAFYIGSLSKGGAERVMTNLAAYFHSQDFRVYLVTKEIDESGEYEVPQGVTRIMADIEGDEISKSRVKNLFARIGKLKKIWKEIKPDVIISFIRKNNLMAIASSRGLHIPVAVSIRSNPARELKGRIFKPLSFFMFRFADGIILQTTQAARFMPSYLQKKIVIMPNSLAEQFMHVEHIGVRRQEIVTVGRIDDNKNQLMLLKAFKSLEDDYPDWTLKLYGDGNQRKAWEEEYADDRIIFAGQVSDVPKHIKDAAIFVLPSKQEGMPNALIEAMAMGLACISTDCPCGGPADIIKQDVNGILIPVDDVEALTLRLKGLMEDENKRNALGREAVKITDRLAPDKVNEEWKQYVLGLIKS